MLSNSTSAFWTSTSASLVSMVTSTLCAQVSATFIGSTTKDSFNNVNSLQRGYSLRRSAFLSRAFTVATSGFNANRTSSIQG